MKKKSPRPEPPSPTPDPSAPMLVLDRLHKNFGPLTAVDRLTLEVRRGELFCFLGPNGAGKTTTIKMLTGLVKPTSGTARIEGVDILAHPLAVKSRMGYIPDMPFLYDRLTLSEFFEFSGELRGMNTGQILAREEELFGVFGLREHRATLVRELSHGMRQRLIYAATLLHDPHVLFVDEPLIGLDPRTIRTIKDLLRERVRAGHTVFLTTHILALAEDIGDRIGLILDGRLNAVGALPDLLAEHGADNLEDLFLKRTEVPGAAR